MSATHHRNRAGKRVSIQALGQSGDGGAQGPPKRRHDAISGGRDSECTHLAAHEAHAKIGFAADDGAKHLVRAGVQQLDPDARKAAVIARDDAFGRK